MADKKKSTAKSKAEEKSTAKDTTAQTQTVNTDKQTVDPLKVYSQVDETLRLISRILEASPDHISFVGRDYIYRYVNRKYSEAHGLPQSRIVGMHVAELLGKDVFEQTIKPLFDKCIAGEEVRYEAWFTFNGIGRRHMSVQYLPLTTESGDIDGLVVISHDSTERKKSEEKLSNSEERFKLAMQGANDGLWDWDLSTNEVYYSPRWKSMLGYAPDELEHTLDTWKRLVHPDDLEQTLDMVNCLREGRCNDFKVEFRMKHKDGSFRHILSRAFLADTAEGKNKRLVGTHVDITDRKKAEEKLVHMHDLMKYVISHAQSAIAVHDKDMKYIYVSEQYLSQYKVKEKDVIGKHHYDVFPDLPQKWKDVHQRVLTGAVEGQDEDPYVREDGSVEWTRWNCLPWYESNGSIGGLIVYTEVITERKRKEEALRKSERRLKESQQVAKIGSWSWDIANNTLDWSDETFRRFDKDPATFKPTFQYYIDRIHPDDRATIQKAIQDSLENNSLYHIQPRIKNESGREWVLEGFGFVERDESGKPIRFAGTGQDITERKQAEEELIESQILLETVIETAPT